jgi:hypothetical protein
MKEIKYTILYCVVRTFVIPLYYGSGSGSGSGTVINYGSGSSSDFLERYGSGSASQKVTVPQRCLKVVYNAKLNGTRVMLSFDRSLR